jgi:hypothetical protein
LSYALGLNDATACPIQASITGHRGIQVGAIPWVVRRYVPTTVGFSIRRAKGSMGFPSPDALKKEGVD